MRAARLVAFALSSFLLFGPTKVAFPQSPALQSVRVSDISIPPDLGYVVETHEPPGTSPSTTRPIIVHIQEAHTNYEAQRHLVSILQQLIDRFELKLILVEGGNGNVSLSYLRGYGPPDNRKAVAEKYLKAGVLSGEEYLDIVSDSPFVIWGVEQEDLYEEHIQAFLETEALQQAVKPILASIREAVGALSPRLLDPAVTELDSKANAFEGGTLGLVDYADFLAGLAKRSGLAKEAYPHLAQFLQVHQLERAIGLEEVQQEQRSLLTALGTRVDEHQVDALINTARQIKTGQATREAFYASLKALAGSAAVDLNEYPNLSRYIRYLEERGRLKPAKLAEELGSLAGRLREALSLSPDSRQLNTITDQLDLIEKFVELKLSPQEYARLKTLTWEGLCSGWVRFLNEQLHRQGLPERSISRLHELEAALPKLQRFYDVALTRDAALVSNTLSKLTETGAPIAVLITGGFHSPQITRLLKEHGVGVVVIAAKVTHQTDERLYRAVLKYKSGRGSFEDVQAAAEQAVASTALR